MTSNRKYRLSHDAEDDLTDILEFSVQQWGKEQAESYRSTIQRALQDLEAFPALGRARDEFGPGTRSYVVGQHVIIYRVTDAEVVVSRIVHERRDLERIPRL